LTRSAPQLRVGTQRDGTFHEGELFVQEVTGERALADRHARVISATVPPSVGAFLAEQHMLVFATQDTAGDLWASVVHGLPGFVSVTRSGALAIDRGVWEVARGDALLGNLELDSPVGLLAIELASRRRYRINGRVVSLGVKRIEIDVGEAYVNCPKYIQRRELVECEAVSGASEPAAHGLTLDPLRQARIRRADTMFVASHHPARGLDASHRGGEPGFIEVRGHDIIRVPEYAGNSLYNTLGNFVISNRAGLAVVDFEDGRVLQLLGHVELAFDARCPYWDFTVSSWTELPLSRAYRWQLLERSRFNPKVSA
jgi:uncharacterized protein